MMPTPTKLYSWLLKLYPAGFREEYQTPMERQFRDDYQDARNRTEKAFVWAHAISDLFTTAPAELVRELMADLKHGFRVYRKRSLSTILAVVALALAIGASTGVFSVLNALLLRDLPFSDPSRLTELLNSPFSPFIGRAAFTAWYHQSSYLQSAAAFSSSDMNLTSVREAFRIKVAETTGNFFPLLGVRPALGRTFAANEDVSGRNSLAVISYGLWQQFYGGNPHVAGATLRVNGAPLTVIGVAPANFDYPSKTAVWIPTVFDFETIPKRGAFFFQTIGRVKPGITLRSAQQLFEADARRAMPAGHVNMSADERSNPHLISLRNQLAGPVRQASWVLAGMTLLVLLTACANIAQLLLSLTTERRQELEVRAALGASRARILQQLSTEAAILTLTAAALGLIVARWASNLTSSIAPAELATQAYTILDWRVLAFALALALLMAFSFGVFPAWLLGRLNPSNQMLRTQSGSGDLKTRRARAGLIAVQVALTLTLVTSSFALGRTFLRMLNADLGFHTANVVTLNVSVQGTKYHGGVAEWGYYSDALNRLRAVPGVQAAAAVAYLPIATNAYMANSFKLDSGQSVPAVVTNAVTPDYFRTMETRFLAGRDFSENKAEQATPSVIVNEAFAKSAGLGKEIVGRSVPAPWGDNHLYRIIGLVDTTSFSGPGDHGGPQIFWAIQEEPPATLTFVAHVSGPADAYLDRCRDALRAVDKEVPIYDVKTLDQRLADAVSRPKFYTTATLFLAALAVLLATVGIHGTAAYSIALRRSEMGIRVALGASYRRIRIMMVREGALPILGGIPFGVAGSVLAGQYLGHLIEGTAQADLSVCVSAAALFLLSGLTAAWSGTGRVLAIDPVEAIRAE